MYSPETNARLDALRAIGQARRLTQTEAAEVVSLIRQDRVSASYASKGAKEAAKPKAKVTPEEAMAKLQALLGAKKG